MSTPHTVRDESAAVMEAEAQLARSHLDLDLDRIDALLHPDYVIIQPGGTVESKAEVLASYRTGMRHWESAEVDQLDIRLYQQTAIVVGRWRASGTHGAERFDYAARFLSVWIKHEGRWQNIAYQSTEIEPA